MSLYGKHFLSIKQLTRQDLEGLFALAKLLEPVARGEMRTNILDGAALGSLFFEPSTRTRLSFDSAFMRLGGRVSHTISEADSSMSKGESVYDTSCVTSGFYDIFTIRHSRPEVIEEFANATNVPVINGGSGPKEHPTQALLDVYTIKKELERNSKTIDGATVTFVGDLKYGRTAHSLVYALSVFSNMTFLLVSPKQLTLPSEVTAYARQRGHKLVCAESLAQALKDSDIVYGTRLQKERLSPEDSSIVIGEEFHISKGTIDRYAKKDIVIMHPLPRDSRPGDFGLLKDLDTDPRLAIFRQTDNGVPIRMALIAQIMGVDQNIENTFVKAGWYRPKILRKNDLQ
ncbi:MAG: aspartate carbamoyltransferase [Bdellovibrionales bacterium]